MPFSVPIRETPVLTRKNCINIIGDQRTVVTSVLINKVLLINVINKKSGSTGTNIQNSVFSLV